ncbi:hypothetical protein NC796_21895 [Aliifodinibius sp. S!AR15-10]|uniref:6-bladed beta-propeller n=1 Tax=Aliifodinibius sp. S!AR15-10 TaxID=2950437 RepID=UPI002866E450|nr:6-bladed beta-propeller [Aliifodinibius sp. S!AR15-10]MDR8393821.1 hypothetical protein [Aliifodinibius sp. S!AR15-10]
MKNLFIGTLLLFIGCTAQKADIPEHIKGTKNLKVYSADPEPTASIELVQEATFKAPEEFFLGWYDDTISLYNWLGGVEISNSGRVYIADGKAKIIHLFAPDGRYLASKGGEGRGPGEYYGLTDTKMVSNRLHVFDFMAFRTTVYAPDSLQVLEASTVRPPVNQEDFDEISEWLRTMLYLRSDGTYLASFMEHWPDHRVGSPNYNLKKDRPIKYYFMNRESKIVSDKILEVRKKHADLVAQAGDRHLANIGSLPFLARTVIEISDDNYIYTTWTDELLIKVYKPDGRYQRAMYYPIQKKVVDRNEIVSMVDVDDWHYDLIQHAELPNTWPAIRSMISDDHNRLWVSTPVEQEGVREWRLLENTGALVAKFRWPDTRLIKAVKMDTPTLS